MDRGKFKSLQEKLAKRLLQWGEIFLSQGGKEIMLKAVAQELPVYVMSVFKLPAGLCDELTKMMREFWWGAENGMHRAHWISWDIMLRPKAKGGMGFKDLRLFNQALLARQACRLIQFPNSLCAQVLRAKYYPDGNLTDMVFTGNASSTWHAIEHGIELLKKGIIWRVGDGASIRGWRDRWIPRGTSYRPITPRRRCRLRWVADFLTAECTWNAQLVQQHFWPVDVADILKIKPSWRLEDFIAWQPDKHGQFSVRSAYSLGLGEFLEEQGVGATSARPDGTRPAWKMIWKCPAPLKVRIFAWKVAQDGLPTQQIKRVRHMEKHDECPICGLEEELTHHALIRCPHAKRLWSAMRCVWDLPAESQLQVDGHEWLLLLMYELNETQRLMLLMLLWRIWQ